MLCVLVDILHATSWSVAPIIEAPPADGPGLAEMARESGAALAELMLADGTLILKVERAGRARQGRIADGERIDAHGGSFVPSVDWRRRPKRGRNGGSSWLRRARRRRMTCLWLLVVFVMRSRTWIRPVQGFAPTFGRGLKWLRWREYPRDAR